MLSPKEESIIKAAKSLPQPFKAKDVGAAFGYGKTVINNCLRDLVLKGHLIKTKRGIYQVVDS